MVGDHRTRNWREAWRRARAAPDDELDVEWRTDDAVRRRQVGIMVVACVVMAAAAV